MRSFIGFHVSFWGLYEGKTVDYSIWDVFVDESLIFSSTCFGGLKSEPLEPFAQ